LRHGFQKYPFPGSHISQVSSVQCSWDICPKSIQVVYYSLASPLFDSQRSLQIGKLGVSKLVLRKFTKRP
jgi:hypothetical protein